MNVAGTARKGLREARRAGAVAALAWIAALAAAVPSQAATTETLRVAALTAKSEYRIGDQIEYVITVEWKAPVQFLRVEPSVALGAFEILRSPAVTEQRLGAGWRRQTLRYPLSTFETGEFTIPEFTVSYRDADGSEKRLPTPPVKIQVVSVPPARPGEPEIREAKPPVMPPFRLTREQLLLAAGGGFLLALIAAALIVRAVRRRRAQPAPLIPPRPIEDVAREELARVAQSDLLARGLIKEYFDQVSDVIRVYLGRRYGFAGIVATTTELIEALREPLSDAGRLALVADFSDEADLAKFAKWQPDRPVCEHFLETAYRVIEETTPAVGPVGNLSQADGTASRVGRVGNLSQADVTASRVGQVGNLSQAEATDSRAGQVGNRSQAEGATPEAAVVSTRNAD